VTVRADNSQGKGNETKTIMRGAEELLEKVGLSLGPIGMTLGESKKSESTEGAEPEEDAGYDDDGTLMAKADALMEKTGLSLGPIGMTLGESKGSADGSIEDDSGSDEAPKSIAPLTTAEWREQFLNADGTVDLFMKDQFNAASRLAGASEFDSLTNIENVAWNGLPSDAIETKHRVRVTDHETGEVLELDVPEGRYVLFEAEQDGWELPNACRMGCCTKCAVKVTKGTLEQPEALGLSKRYRDEGYALLCVATATSDVECVTQDEEEVYQMQFGELFQQLATDVESGAVVRDDFALEIADMDE
jgi:ferredoxin